MNAHSLGQLRCNRALGQGLVSPGAGAAAMVGLLVVGVTLWAAWFLLSKPAPARA